MIEGRAKTDSLSTQLLSQLGGAPLREISSQLGIDQAQASTAVGAALPLLLGALGQNASRPQGTQALLGALQKDHAGGGDIAGLLGAVLGGSQSRQTDGGAILGHIFGGRQARAETWLGQATGLGGDKAAQLLKILAPLVLAYLAKRMFQGGQGQAQAAAGGGSAADQLGAILGREQQQARSAPATGDLLGAVLDQDGDGQLGLGDLLRIGGGLLGGGKR